VSKAFTREDEVADFAPIRPAAPLPPGVKNYITADGAQRLRDELTRLQNTRAGAANDRARLNEIDQRLSLLTQILATLVIAPTASGDQVLFGSSAEVKYPSGDIETFRLVGVNEIDLDRNWISWQSPLAKALLNAKAGDTVRFKAPSGEQKLEVLSVQNEGQG
jgi:transcription elongation factor GreB